MRRYLNFLYFATEMWQINDEDKKKNVIYSQVVEIFDIFNQGYSQLFSAESELTGIFCYASTAMLRWRINRHDNIEIFESCQMMKKIVPMLFKLDSHGNKSVHSDTCSGTRNRSLRASA